MRNPEQYIQKERLVQTFTDLVKIDSPSTHERDLSAYLAKEFAALGCEIYQDEIHNLVAKYAGNCDKETVMLCAHMDTVGSDVGVKPQIANGKITSDGTTILGADDKSGVAIILEIIRVLNAYPEITRPNIEAVITVQEEIGLIGSKFLDKSRLESKWGIILDHGGPIGSVVISGPSSRSYRFIIHGKAAHAAVAPQDGINAIQAAAAGIVNCPCGQIDPLVVSGIGKIQGGIATNIVPDLVTVDAMIRSRNQAKLEMWAEKMERAFADGCKSFGASLEIEKSDSYTAYELTEESKPWQAIQKASERLGFSFAMEHSLGGTDANNFNQAGIPTIATSTGMANEHMKTEFIEIQDLYDSARLIINAIAE